MAVAGLVLGIVAIVFSFIPVLGMFIAIPCAIVGGILSAIAFGTRKDGQGRGMAIAGGILSILAIVISILLAVLVFAAVDDAVDDLDRSLEEISDSLSTDDGREFMLRQPCVDVMAEYNAMVGVTGHDSAVLHVSNVYNLKADFGTYVAVSDAAARIRQCQ